MLVRRTGILRFWTPSWVRNARAGGPAPQRLRELRSDSWRGGVAESRWGHQYENPGPKDRDFAFVDGSPTNNARPEDGHFQFSFHSIRERMYHVGLGVLLSCNDRSG